MPTADSFTALGRCNGFPFCPAKVDVSGFAHWITLGGVSSGSASQSEINESLVNAMKLFWNLYSIKGSFSCALTNSQEGNISVEADDHELIVKGFEESDALTPKKRACLTGIYSIFKDEEESEEEDEDDEDDDDDDDDDDGSGDVTQKVEGNLTAQVNIVRMYDGSTDEESNFVGYGMRTVDLVLTDSFVFPPNPTAGGVQISVGSFINATDDSGVDPDSFYTFDQKVFQTDLGGIPFRSFTYCEAIVSSGLVPGVTNSLSVSASELSGTASTTSNKVAISGSPSTYSVSMSISASVGSDLLDFYTYN